MDGRNSATRRGVNSGASARRWARQSSPSAVKRPWPSPVPSTRNCSASLR